jgi:hypothetical protein
LSAAWESCVYVIRKQGPNRTSLERWGATPAVHQSPNTMARRKQDSEMRKADRESRLSGRWTGIGFIIVLLGALIALFLLLGSG